MTEYEQNPAPCKGCKWSSEYISWLEPDREGRKQKFHIRAGICISLVPTFPLQYSGHISIHYTCFSGHILSGMSELVLRALYLGQVLLRAGGWGGWADWGSLHPFLFPSLSPPAWPSTHLSIAVLRHLLRYSLLPPAKLWVLLFWLEKHLYQRRSLLLNDKMGLLQGF